MSGSTLFWLIVGVVIAGCVIGAGAYRLRQAWATSRVLTAAWKIRVAIERGLVRPAHVGATPLFATVGEVTRAVYYGFLFLLACKWLYAKGEATVFCRTFAGPWCGVSERQARDAITALKRLGYLIDTGERYRQATLWLPRSGE
jgi:hypothetical protein